MKNKQIGVNVDLNNSRELVQAADKMLAAIDQR